MTFASLVPNPFLQTVPQALLMHTSTTPRVMLAPPTSLTSPSLQLPAETDCAENRTHDWKVNLTALNEELLTLTNDSYIIL